MDKRIVSYLSYGTLILGVLIGIYVFADIYLIKSKLPSGICPVVRNKPLLYSAIVLCGISFILSLFESKNGYKN